MRSHRRHAVVFGLFFALSGAVACSGDKEEPEEPASKPSKEDEPDEPAADAPAKAQEEDEEEAEELSVDAPEPADPAPLATPDPAPVAAEPPGFTGKKVTRYVTSFALNVRSLPSKEAGVVRHVKWGDKVEVVINGEWAKLGAGEYLSINRLSDKPPTPKGAKGAPKATAAAPAPAPTKAVAPAKGGKAPAKATPKKTAPKK